MGTSPQLGRTGPWCLMIRRSEWTRSTASVQTHGSGSRARRSASPTPAQPTSLVRRGSRVPYRRVGERGLGHQTTPVAGLTHADMGI